MQKKVTTSSYYAIKTEKEFFEGVATYIHVYNSKRPHSVLMNRTATNPNTSVYIKINPIPKPKTDGLKKYCSSIITVIPVFFAIKCSV